MNTPITKELPPKWIYDKSVELFNADFRKGEIYAVDGKIHCAYPELLTDELIAHEEKHIEQQEIHGWENWWERYFEYPNFRLEQEILAYQAQYAYTVEHYNHNGRRFALKEMAKTLSSELYGNLISFEDAKYVIKHEVTR